MEQQVKFASGSLQLYGTLRLPDASDPIAVILLIPGSGRTDRNGSTKQLPINSLSEIAQFLAENQIATFRYDKRGVGESEGSYLQTGFYERVSDASSALAYLKNQPQFHDKPVFILGHSEGALICTRIAAKDSNIAGAILLAGSAKSGEATLKWRVQEMNKDSRGLNKFIINFFHIDILKSHQKSINKIKNSSKEGFRRGLQKSSVKWMREFVEYNPVEDFPKIQIPLLAITGAKDVQIDPKDLLIMSKTVRSEFEYYEIPDMNHLLRSEKKKPILSTYKKQVKQSLEPRLLDLIIQWIRKHVTS